MKTGFADLPLHGGKAPRWLFDRMVQLSRQITIAIVEEFGPAEMLRRLSDPYWFQAFGCVLGFDWHSSGVTTTVGGALKQGLKGLERNLEFFVAGGKGATSRKTPAEIQSASEKNSINAEPLIYASRMSAKVDSAAVQDGYQLYHHNFFFTSKGEWCVVQQGMNDANRGSRRYHWLSENLRDYVCEPHAAVCSDVRVKALNMVAEESKDSRDQVAFLSRQSPDKVVIELKKIQALVLPTRHFVDEQEDVDPKRFHKILLRTYERQPENFETLLGVEGVGAKTVRALTFVAEIIYGSKPSFSDPARFSYAHGGKDGHPYPVNREVYDRSIQILKSSIEKSKLGQPDRMKAVKRLFEFYRESTERGLC